MPPVRQPVQGYPMLASLMSLMPEAAIFRRFGQEAILALLYRQAELTTLSDKLRELQQLDNEDQNKGYLYARDWEYLIESSETDNAEQLKLVQEITTKVEQYREFYMAEGSKRC
jgi:hypothetical protein